jgi:hypothetical protein
MVSACSTTTGAIEGSPRMKKTLTAMIAVAALSLTTACGGGGGDERPTQAELKKAITSDDSVFGTSIPESAADCIAGALEKSDVSDKTLNAIVENDKDYKGSDEDEKALTSLQSEVTKCATSGS